MSVFLDASVIVAILAREPDAALHESRLEEAEGQLLVSPLVVFEATIGLARSKAGPGVRLTSAGIRAAQLAVSDFLAAVEASGVALTVDAAVEAIDAVARYGKYVGHPASLNMGDAFSYACAKAAGASLLYKGGDFSHTDVPAA